MIRKIRSPIPNHVRVIFELPASIWADHIYLVGDFNCWSTASKPMHQDRDGIWRTSVDLPNDSQCEFRYLVDGQWKSDYHADAITPNTYGSQNSIVIAALPVDALVLERTSSQAWEVPAHDVVVG